MKTTKQLNEIIKTLDPGPENVVNMGLPLDIQKKVRQNKIKCIELLNETIFCIEETRKYVTNRAREELSHEQHNAVYDQLDKVSDDENLKADNWAEAWLMIVELQDTLDDLD